MPNELKQQVFNELRAEAAMIYSTAQTARSVITGVNMKVEDVDVQGAAKYIWDSFLSVAEQQQKLEAVVSYIAKENPASDVFTKTLAAIKDGTAFMEVVNFNGYIKVNNENAAKVFMIYATEDAKVAKDLKMQLYPMVLNGEITNKDMYDVPAGTTADDYYLSALGEADIVLLLLTGNFFSPDNNCLKLGFNGIDMKKRVVPVLIEDTLWGRIKVLSGIVPLPVNRKPVSNWSNKAQALMTVAEGVSQVARHLKQ